MQAFFDMGGYALYVWLAYGTAVAILAGLWIGSRIRLSKLQRSVDALKADREA